jgi:hypothetical protein
MKSEDVLREIANDPAINGRLSTIDAIERGSPDAGVVVCIKSIHAHEQVHRYIADIIEVLATRHGFELLCVEGATGPGDIFLLASMPPKTREQFCTSLFKRGYLTGPEYVAANRPHLGVELWGVDDPELYRKQWRAARQAMRVATGILSELRQYRETLWRSCNVHLRPAVRDCCQLLQQEARGDITDAEFSRRVVGYAKLAGVPVPAHITRGVSEEAEFADYVSHAAAPDLDEEELMRLVSRERSLWKYRQSYVQLTGSYESETRAFCWEVLETLSADGTTLDQEFGRLFRWLSILIGMCGLTLASDQAQEVLSTSAGYVANVVDIAAKRIIRVLGRVSAPESLSSLEPERITRIIERCWDAPYVYHRVAKERAFAMIQNAVQAMDRRKFDRCVTVVGGYQAGDMAHAARAFFNLSSVVLMPHIIDSAEIKASHQRWLDRLMERE